MFYNEISGALRLCKVAVTGALYVCVGRILGGLTSGLILSCFSLNSSSVAVP